MRGSVLSIVLMFGGAAVYGQTEKFSIRVGRGGLSGVEEYTIAPDVSGYRLTGKIRLQRSAGTQELSHEEVLGNDWAFISYKLDASVAGQLQTIRAHREGSEVRIQATAAGRTLAKAVAFDSSTVLLDNLVGSHYQVLLNRIHGASAAPQNWSVVVPQAMAAVPGKLSAGGALEPALLHGRSLQVRKYTLELANVLVELWAETGSNRFMRLRVPVQDVEIARDGFGLTSAAAAGSAAPSHHEEREVTFSSAGLSFPATLTIPASRPGKVPAVVLVHGSGPHDRDESIGPNKPFRDLAAGLSAAGIATLRYDKRTFAFRGKTDLRAITLDGEVIDDAVAALEYLRTQPGIDPGRVYVLGHSLGGTAAPMIAARVPWLRGVVLMAAAVRPLDELIFEQTARGLELANTSSDEIKTRVDGLKAQFRRVRTGEAPDDEMVFFAPARYWRDLFGRDPLKAVRELRVPVLVLQGGKDIQVGKADYDLIVGALSGRPADAREFHWFPTLNHLMMQVEGDPTGAEYGRAGAVAPEVISAVSAWIGKH